MKKKEPNKQRNHVAQHSWNKSGAGAHKDKTKYCRKDKHKGSGKDLYFSLYIDMVDLSATNDRVNDLNKRMKFATLTSSTIYNEYVFLTKEDAMFFKLTIPESLTYDQLRELWLKASWAKDATE